MKLYMLLSGWSDSGTGDSKRGSNHAILGCMTLDDCRRFYAEEVRFAANIRSPSLVEAFARVPREKFLGPGPWRIGCANVDLSEVTYIPTDDADPSHVYHNVVIAIDTTRDLNNGQPAALARWIDALELKSGDRVFHLGCGVGYYTAIIAEVVGRAGRVIASEVDQELAARARQNLASYANVEVHAGDGAAFDPGACDAMLINAGVTHPHSGWLDRLRQGGRVVLPLTIAMGATLGRGVMAKITREHSGFSARVVTFVAIYSCTSVRDPQIEPLMGKALANGMLLKMQSLRRDAHEPGESCAVHGREACLSILPAGKCA